MPSPEIILLGGSPGSGKSSIGERFESMGVPKGARHKSIGDLKRDITSGKIKSIHADRLNKIEHPDRRTGAAPSDAMADIMEEFIMMNPSGLTIVDGFPRYMDRVEPFKESMQRIGANVLALVVVEVDDEKVLMERLMNREVRPEQKIKDPTERLADHRDNVVPTLSVLAADYPTYRLDGTLPIEKNAEELLVIYERHSVKSNKF